ncbi:sodium-coupled monocarboxylate transporter 1-like, partial [Paramuricea clavata]
VLPFFVIDKLGYLTGVPGLFIAALFSGSLSTVSSGINSLTAIILEDIIKKIKKNIPDSEATFLSKIIGVIYGGIIIMGAIALRFAKVPLLIQLTASLFNISAGPLLGLFTLGMLSKRANWKGAYIGTICSFVVLGWIYIGSLYYPSPNVSAPPTSVEKCVVFNATRSNMKVKNDSVPLAGLYGLSFLYYGAVGML